MRDVFASVAVQTFTIGYIEIHSNILHYTTIIDKIQWENVNSSKTIAGNLTTFRDVELNAKDCMLVKC